ncbi:D-alanyl-D-alanine carboxypeptidase family protein [Paracoccaceae bacterium Fryx2]|nr:D-alanyl-D-alanine carboxypeptidase family protein [Paracoccaceae bacterium Fryx2]
MFRHLALVLAFGLAALPAQAFDTRAGAAWVYDVTTGTVLLDKNGDESLPPASMSKLMTLNMLFEALKDGRVTMDTTFSVSTRAREMGGSTMFLNEMDKPTVEDLIHGIIINSGNDACVVVAEGLSGSEATFSQQMTERARALGMTKSNFTNASGWPDPEHRMSMHDLGVLANRLITEFPEYYPFFAMTGFNYKDRAPANSENRNPLLKLGSGGDWTADGLKTGHTMEAGYGLVGSAKRGDRRVIFAITGLASEKDRAEESESLANWAFRQFVLKTVVTKGQRLAEADVWMGEATKVGMVAERDVQLLLPALVQGQVTAEVSYTGPLTAPVAQGAKVADLVIHVPGLPDAHVPLLAETAVPRGGFATRLGVAVQVLRTRFAPEAPAS